MDMLTTTIPTADLKVGSDSIEFLGDFHPVASVDQYVSGEGIPHHPTVPALDRRIVCTDGFSISPESAGTVRIAARR